MNRLARSPAFWFSVFLAFYLAGRIASPGDLNTKDQPRTVAYTVDMLQNGHWRLPSDMMGRPATKPPLYNWIAALPIAATGIYHTFTFKLPSLLAGLGCLFWIALFVRHLHRLDLPDPIPFAPVFWLASLAWLANFSVYGLIYTARPDMVLAFFLFAGWTISTLLMEQSPLVRDRAWLWSLALWLSLQAAFLAKGTPAVLLVLYVPLYALIRFGSLKPALRTRFLLGVPAVALFSFLWFQSAWNDLPMDHRSFLLNMESSRITEGGILETLKGIYKMPHYFLVRFLPWSLAFLWLFLAVHRARPATFPWAPVYTWFLLLLVFFSIPTFKRDDYLLPLYPVCALAAGYAAWKLPRPLRWGATSLAVVLVAGSMAADAFFSQDLLPRYADNCARFAQSVRKTVPPGARLVFRQTGYNNLQAFLGRNAPFSASQLESLRAGDFLLQPAYLLSKDQAKAYRTQGPALPEYQECPSAPLLKLELLHLSGPISHVSGNKPGLVGLYRVVESPSTVRN